MLSIAVIGGGRCNITNSFAQDYVKKNHQHPIQQTAHRASGSRWRLHHENELKLCRTLGFSCSIVVLGINICIGDSPYANQLNLNYYEVIHFLHHIYVVSA